MKRTLKLVLLTTCIVVFLVNIAAAQGGVRTPAPAAPIKPPPRRAQPREQRRTPRREVNSPAPEAVARRVPPPATLAVKTFPTNCAVMLNARPVGTTGADGRLRVSALKPGQYILTMRREDYRYEQRTIQLEAGQEASIEVVLNALPGSLNIMPNVSGADIQISNVGSYVGQVTNLTLAPGVYQVEATRPGYQKATQTIEILPNRSLEIALRLDILPTEQALAQAEQALLNRNYETALLIGETILATQPEHPQANLLMGYSYFNSSRFGEGIPYLSKALALNQQVAIPIKRYRKVSFGDDLFSGQLVLRRNSFGFQSGERPGFDFNVAANKIYEMKAEPQKGGRLYVQIGVPRGSKEKKEKFYFHPSSATIIRSGRSNSIACANCQEELQAILRLVQRLR